MMAGNEAIHADEASQAGDQSVGLCRSVERLRL